MRLHRHDDPILRPVTGRGKAAAERIMNAIKIRAGEAARRVAN
jgi:hypothetical protein